MYCGLDFGTSNSTLGVVTGDLAQLVALEDSRTTLPSASFYREGQTTPRVGREAIATYLEGDEGRLLRSMKSVLGTSLMDESTQIGNSSVPMTRILGDYLREMKTRAETVVGESLTQVMHGRPVFFVDGNEEGDRRAENILRDVLLDIGFKDIAFQLEPLAAARHFRSHVNHETLVFIADIGGGTSDFSIVRVMPESHSLGMTDAVLANHGVRVGGTDFDHNLSIAKVMPLLGYGANAGGRGLPTPNWIYIDLATPSKIARLYSRRFANDIGSVIRSAPNHPGLTRLGTVMDNRLGHELANNVEEAKIGVTTLGPATIDLSNVEPGLSSDVHPDDILTAVVEGVSRIESAMDECLRLASVQRSDIGLVALTGGSTAVPQIKAAITAQFPFATITDTDKFGAVGTGLALAAKDHF